MSEGGGTGRGKGKPAPNLRGPRRASLSGTVLLETLTILSQQWKRQIYHQAGGPALNHNTTVYNLWKLPSLTDKMG